MLDRVRFQLKSVDQGPCRRTFGMVNDHHAVLGFPIAMDIEQKVGHAAPVFARNLKAREAGRSVEPGRRLDGPHAEEPTTRASDFPFRTASAGQADVSRTLVFCPSS